MADSTWDSSRPEVPQNTEPLVAAVTGGASGIGLAFAQKWLSLGHRVVLMDGSLPRSRAALSDLGSDKAWSVEVDVRSTEAVDAAFEMVSMREGQLDVLVNCAGISRPGASDLIDDRDWQLMVDIHLGGPMRCCRAAFSMLAASAHSAIVNISSVAGTMGMPERASYNTVKSGIEGFTRSLAVEWAPHGIRCNAVAPGYTNTPFLEKLAAEKLLDRAPIVERTPMRRFAEPGEIAESIYFLASSASSFITGQTLIVDGGLTVSGDWYPAK